MRLFLVIFAATCFLGENVTDNLGINRNIFQMVILLMGFILMANHKTLFSSLNSLKQLLTLTIVFSIFKLVFDQSDGTRALVLSVIGAPLLFASFPIYRKPRMRQTFCKSIFNIFIIFYLVETLLALYETASGHTVFGYLGKSEQLEAFEAAVFRSTALMGHPLYNALIVSLAMAFFLTSRLKNKYKISLWLIGFASILCFNTRGSIAVNVLMFLVFVFKELFFNKKISGNKKITLIAVASCVFLFGAYLIFVAGLGGRLFALDLQDDWSAQTRIDVWRIFNYVDIDTYIFGCSSDQILSLMHKANLIAIENFWIDWLLRFGIIFFALYLWLFGRLFVRLFKNYKKFDYLYIVGSFLLVASVNCSLSSSFIAVFLFLVCCIIFTPQVFTDIIPDKYLEKNE